MGVWSYGWVALLCWSCTCLVLCSTNSEQNIQIAEYLKGDNVCVNYTTKIVLYKETYIAKKVKINKCTLWDKLKGKCFGKTYPRFITVIGYRMVNKTRNVPVKSCCEGFREYNGTCGIYETGFHYSTNGSALEVTREMYMLMMVGLPVTGIVLISGFTICLVVGIAILKKHSIEKRNRENVATLMGNPIYNLPEEQPYEKLRLFNNVDHTDTYDTLQLYQDVD